MTGKGGALVATIFFPDMETVTLLKLSGFSCIAGLALTILFIGNVTSMDLSETDAFYHAAIRGDETSYTGEAVNPKNLSLWENLTGRGKPYVARPKGTGASEPFLAKKDDSTQV